MGQTSSSSSVSSSGSLSSDPSSSLPSEYSPYPPHPSPFPSSTALVSVEEDVPTPPPSDGYRWRKYGQKSVKGSAYARNYYKCTYPGCTVKKQVDKINSNGKVVDQVLCKGEHCHGPPQITRINAHDQQTFRNSVITESLAHTEIMVKHEDSPSRSGSGSGYVMQQGNIRNSGGGGGGASSNSTTSSALSSRSKSAVGAGSQIADSYMMYHIPTLPYDSPQHNLSHPNNGAALIPYNNSMNNDHPLNSYNSPNVVTKISNANTNSISNYESGEKAPTHTNTLSESSEGNKYSDNNNNNSSNNTPSASNTSVNITSTPNATTNNLNNSTNNITQTQTTQSGTTVTSPRLVIETNISVDCLDDGYHWRKYGQKTVKGSPFPRSYYKCTEKGCSVKKQVEQNGTSIVNTYEGTHTHLAPAFDDSTDMSKKRRLRRSEGPEASFKRMHKSLEDVTDIKASQSSDNLQNNPQFHTPMPIGSIGSILQHTSHLQSMNYLPPTVANLTPQPVPVYSNQPDSNFASLASLSGPKVRVDTAPALAPLHSFSHTAPSPSQGPHNDKFGQLES